nr:2-dehydropantoate 2-reductase [Thermophilibacter immobilis]
MARSLGPDAVEYVMDGARFERHQGEALAINGVPCRVKTIPSQDASPTDLVILATKATGLAGTLVVAEDLVGPRTRVVPLLNGTTSEERVAARFGWKNTVISVAQGMDATFIEGELTYAHPGEVRFGAASGTAQETVSDVADFYARVGMRETRPEDAAERVSLSAHSPDREELRGPVGSICRARLMRYDTVHSRRTEHMWT